MIVRLAPRISVLDDVIFPVADICPTVVKLPPLTLPVALMMLLALTLPVTDIWVFDTTTTLATPLTPIVILAPLDATFTLLLPLLILAGLVSTFVKNAPLPMKYEAVTLPVTFA